MLPPATPADELSRLALSPDAAVRRAVAQHPNAPAAVLGALASFFPAEVASNPALALLRLAEPQLLQQWPAAAAERLVQLSSAPDWLLDAALRHPAPQVQWALSRRTQLSSALLTRLVKRPEWFLRAAAARHPQLAAEWHLILASDPDYGVRLSLASRPDLSSDVRQALRQDPHALVRQRAGV